MDIEEVICKEVELTPLRLALLIAENEDLIKIGAVHYPLDINVDKIPPFLIGNIEVNFPYVPFTCKFTSDMMLVARRCIRLENTMSLQTCKIGLLCELDYSTEADVPLRVHNRRIFE